MSEGLVKRFLFAYINSLALIWQSPRPRGLRWVKLL